MNEKSYSLQIRCSDDDSLHQFLHLSLAEVIHIIKRYQDRIYNVSFAAEP